MMNWFYDALSLVVLTAFLIGLIGAFTLIG
jgi:hypothetical protein